MLNTVNRHVFKWDNQNLVPFFQTEADVQLALRPLGMVSSKGGVEKGAFVGDHYPTSLIISISI